MYKKPLLLALSLAVAVTFTPAFAADEKPSGKGGKHGHGEVKVTIPPTADALWTEIEARQKALTDAVNAKKSEGMHELAETISGLVAAVPGKYPELAPEKKKRVEGQVKNVVRVLDELHEEAEEGHWDDAAKKLKQTDAALKIVKGQIAK